MKVLREWKKVFESDLEYIVSELKEVIKLPALIILSGEVGAGKTTFTKYFFQSQNPKTQDHISSPSYSIINEIGNIAHADFYRIKNIQEVIHLELGLYLEGKDYLIVEWGRPYLPQIQKELVEGWNSYELFIDINESVADPSSLVPSRNIILRELTE